jgi:hypothetical protein
MARKSPNKRTLQIVMPEAAYEAMQEYARTLSTPDKTVFVSDIVRKALREYFGKIDPELDFDVDRGGYRGHKPELQNPDEQSLPHSHIPSPLKA